MNILNKQGFLTIEDRKAPLIHSCNYLTFKSCLDLSTLIQISSSRSIVTLNDYSNDLASFFCWWTHFVQKDLNGFSGFSHVKFELIGFEVV